MTAVLLHGWVAEFVAVQCRDAHARAQGPCPNCNTENFTYFGDIFTVKGNREEQAVNCRECKAQLSFRAEERSVRPRVMVRAGLQ